MIGPRELLDDFLSENELKEITARFGIPDEDGADITARKRNLAAPAPTLPEPPLDEKQDKIDQMLEASGAQPVLLGS